MNAYSEAKRLNPRTTSCCVLALSSGHSETTKSFAPDLVFLQTFKQSDRLPVTELCNKIATRPAFVTAALDGNLITPFSKRHLITLFEFLKQQLQVSSELKSGPKLLILSKCSDDSAKQYNKK